VNTTPADQSPCYPKEAGPESQTEQNHWSFVGEAKIKIGQLIPCNEQRDAAHDCDKNAANDPEQCHDYIHKRFYFPK
jgi:hypothetical protein